MSDTSSGSHRLEPTPETRAPVSRDDREAEVGRYVDPVRPNPASVPVVEQRVLPAKTSAAAVFALVFGVSALLSVLTLLLAPLAVVLAIIGIILGVIGLKMAKRVGVTGRGVALGGLVLSLIAVVLAGTIAAGVTTVLNNKQAVNRLDKQIQKLRDNLPTKVTTPST